MTGYLKVNKHLQDMSNISLFWCFFFFLVTQASLCCAAKWEMVPTEAQSLEGGGSQTLEGFRITC